MRIIKEDKNKAMPKGRKLHCELFDSLGEFIKYAQTNPKTGSSDKPYQEDWHGPHAKSLKATCELATEGWTELRPRVDNILTDVTERLADKLSELYKPMYDFGGAYVDMGRFVEGDPECMVNFSASADNGIGRVIKVVVAGTASAYIQAEWLMARGVAVLSLIDTINKLGFGVELWWDSTISGDENNAYTTAVKLHDSADTLDINSVMFALAHPSMLRRLTFSVQEQSETAHQQHATLGSGYGVPHKMGLPMVDDYDVIVEKLQDGSGDIVRDPMGWVMQTLKGMELIPSDI